MTEIETNSQDPSAASELESVVADILLRANLTDTSKITAAAKVLGIEPRSLQIVGEQRDIEAKFAEAIAPIKEVLRGKENPTREEILKMAKADELLDQLVAINQERTIPELAEKILKGFKKLRNEVIEITLPEGMTIQEAGKVLNAAAKTPVEEGGKGWEAPVFNERDSNFWELNEAKDDRRTVPGQAYRFQVFGKESTERGVRAPLGALAIAEACERFLTNNGGTLFRDGDGYGIWVLGLNKNVALNSRNRWTGVGVTGLHPAIVNVGFASLVSADD